MEVNLTGLTSIITTVGFPIVAYLLLYLRLEQVVRQLVNAVTALKGQIAVLTFAIAPERGDDPSVSESGR